MESFRAVLAVQDPLTNNVLNRFTRRSSDHTWLTADEAARYLGLRTRMALYQAVRRGQIPAHHLGRRLRFRRSELDALLSAR